MKRVAILVALVAAASAVSSAAAGTSVGERAAGARAAKAKVLCWNKDYPEPVGNGNAQVRVKPSKCKFIKRGEAAEFAAVQVRSLNWKKWGNRKTIGIGKNCSPMAGTCTRVKVRLNKALSRCGRRVYSKVEFRFPRFNNSAGFKLWTC